MKKIKLTLISLFVLSLSTSLKAQPAGLEVGGALFLISEDVFDAGLDLRGVYAIDSDWRAAGSIGLFLPEKDGNLRAGAISINAEANYLVDIGNDVFTPYAIAGLNLTRVRVQYDAGLFGSYDESDWSAGLNLGIGGDFEVGQSFTPFAEIKYVGGDADFIGLYVGAKIGL